MATEIVMLIIYILICMLNLASFLRVFINCISNKSTSLGESFMMALSLIISGVLFPEILNSFKIIQKIV